MKSGIDRAHFDTAVRPQDDLFRYVNGAWLETAEIPADRAFDGAFYHLREKAEADLRVLIEECAAGEADGSPEEAQKVGDLYASFLDEQRADELGLAPVQADLARALAADGPDPLLLGGLARKGVDGVFGMYVDTDAKQPDRYIVNLVQGGLGLPDESYYREERYAAVRASYVAHLTAMLELAGVDDAPRRADDVMALETRLAAAHWDRVKSRDESLTYNSMTIEELKAATPGFDWPRFLVGLTERDDVLDNVVVRQPSYFTAMAEAVGAVDTDVWRSWLASNVLRAYAPYLGKEIVEEHFGFYGRTLSGIPENRERWKRGVSVVEGSLGEALGRLYVTRHFPPEAKERMLVLVDNLIEAFREDIEALDWMSPETKVRALDKLAKFTPKIGYPDKWRDYSSLVIERDDLVGNVHRAHAFEIDRNVAKIGQPVDRLEWFMTPQTVNAYYNPGMNEIVFPAAMLQPPFFDVHADDAVNYGSIGAVIGHEIGHGFDDQGSKYDGDGALVDWWTPADRSEFEKRTNALIAQYDELEPEQVPGHKVNGALTVGENIGDLGGLTVAHKAYLLSLNGNGAPELDGYTGLQRLFLGWAQSWQSKGRDEEVIRRLAIDPHSPAEFRCNAVVRNLTEFYAAFDVHKGDDLWLPEDDRVRIW